MVKNDEQHGDAAEALSVRPTMVRTGRVTLGHKKNFHFRSANATITASAPLLALVRHLERLMNHNVAPQTRCSPENAGRCYPPRCYQSTEGYDVLC